MNRKHVSMKLTRRHLTHHENLSTSFRLNLCLKTITCERISVSLCRIQSSVYSNHENLSSPFACKYTLNRSRDNLINIPEVVPFVTFLW